MILVKLLGFAMLIGTVRAFFTDYANEGAAYLRIDAEDPETLLGVSPARLVAAQRRKRKAARSCGNIVNINAYRKRKERNA